MLLTSDKFYRLLGDRIKIERLRNKISQEDVAAHLDLTRTSIINLEKGRHRPSIYQLLQLADLFKVDYTLLLPPTIDNVVNKTNNSNELENMVIDQEIGEDTKKAIRDFLTSIKQ